MSRIPANFDLEASIVDFRAESFRYAKQHYEDRIRNIDTEADSLRQNHKIAQIADAHGWESDWSPGANYTIDVHIDITDLPRARKAFGKFTVYTKWLKDAEQRIVRVTLTCENHPKLRVMYEKVVPCDGTGRCKIVPVLAPAELRYELVCSR